MRRAALVLILLAVVACRGEPMAAVQSPPLVVAPPREAPSSSEPPVEVRFVDATTAPTSIALPACHQLLVTAAKGTVVAGGQTLSVGDVLATTSGPVELHGDGVAVVATTAVTPCGIPQRLVLSSAAPDLAFMGGAMHARLDLDDRAVVPSVYFGRLMGTAGVAEHAHDKSWEVLCAVEAAGTFTLAGQVQRLGPRTCVFVPPGAKHSWQPDPGSTLVAVQLYAPPGPEQRFKKLAAEPAK
jgi:mannose-6-phosphate isomerase-like protein (cupin superfamily)